MKQLLVGFLASLAVLAASVESVLAVSAQDVVQNYLGVTFGGPCSTSEITGILCVFGKLILYLLTLGGAVSLVFLVVGGMQYMASGGDQKALETAKSTITYSVLGLLIIMLASAVISTVLGVVGLSPSP